MLREKSHVFENLFHENRLDFLVNLELVFEILKIRILQHLRIMNRQLRILPLLHHLSIITTPLQIIHPQNVLLRIRVDILLQHNVIFRVCLLEENRVKSESLRDEALRVLVEVLGVVLENRLENEAFVLADLLHYELVVICEEKKGTAFAAGALAGLPDRLQVFLHVEALQEVDSALLLLSEGLEDLWGVAGELDAVLLESGRIRHFSHHKRFIARIHCQTGLLFVHIGREIAQFFLPVLPDKSLRLLRVEKISVDPRIDREEERIFLDFHDCIEPH